MTTQSEPPSKRHRTTEEEDQAFVIMGEGLRKLMDTLQRCELIDVQVQTLSGGLFTVTMERGNDVAVLKKAIEDAEGTDRHRQELFFVEEEGDAHPLKDSDQLPGSCTVALCAHAPPEFEWDSSSNLIRTKEFKLSGELNSTVTKAQKNRKDSNCMMTTPAMEAGTHTVSFKLMQGSASGIMCFCGVVSNDDDVSCHLKHYQEDSTVGWFISNGGTLHGNEKDGTNYAGIIRSGQVLTMQVDIDAGTLKFWLDGKPHGPGYTRGVTGPLRWATTVYYRGNAVEIVPNPELQP